MPIIFQDEPSPDPDLDAWITRTIGERLWITLTELQRKYAGKKQRSHATTLAITRALRRLGWKPKRQGTSTIGGVRGSWWVKDCLETDYLFVR